MKALFVRKLYLWPRFEAHVKEALNDLPIEVCHALTLMMLSQDHVCPVPRCAFLRPGAVQLPHCPAIAHAHMCSGWWIRGCVSLCSDHILVMQVIELAQEMTPGMVTIYDAIVDLMDACIKELKRANKIDTSDMTLEECLFRSFDDMIRRQLDPIWHTVTPKTKQVNSHASVSHARRVTLLCL